MMETKDYVSFLIGIVLAALGALPLLSKANIGPGWFALPWFPLQIAMYIVAAAGFYLMVNSVIEITNSNAIGWWSFLIAIVFLAIGVLQVLAKFKFGPSWFELSFVTDTFYHIIFLVEGLFLMVACFAMEI